MRTIVAQDGLMTLGSTGQWRAHPLLTEIRAIEAAMLRIETELGIGPLARKRLGVATVTTRSTLDELAVRRRGPENPCEMTRICRRVQPGCFPSIDQVSQAALPVTSVSDRPTGRGWTCTSIKPALESQLVNSLTV